MKNFIHVNRDTGEASSIVGGRVTERRPARPRLSPRIGWRIRDAFLLAALVAVLIALAPLVFLRWAFVDDE